MLTTIPLTPAPAVSFTLAPTRLYANMSAIIHRMPNDYLEERLALALEARSNFLKDERTTALRLFQQMWPHLTSNMNSWLEWMMEIVCTSMNWDKPESISMQPVTLSDDLEMRQVWLQLSASNLVSKRTAFSPWGVDASEEQKRIFQEQAEFDKLHPAGSGASRRSNIEESRQRKLRRKSKPASLAVR